MAEVKRYSGRTYAKSSETSASRAFDEIFSKPKPKNTKWGNTSYSKPRNDDSADSKKSAMEQEESSDPFSFEFDADRSPTKKKTAKITASVVPRTVVMQPAVRISSSNKTEVKYRPKSALDDETASDDFTLKKGNVRPYTKRAGRKIKQEQEQETSQTKMDNFVVKTEKPDRKKVHDSHSADTTQGTSQESSGMTSSLEDSFVEEDGLYIEKDDGSSLDVKDTSFLIPDEEENIFIRPKREQQSMINSDGNEVTVRFRSQYLNPEVYSKFTENISPKDPVGQLSNSKVVHKNVLKHDSGTTLIVVCSPKVDEDAKQSTTQTKYFRDNVKEINKHKKKYEERTKGNGNNANTPPEKDPFEMEDDPITDNSNIQPAESSQGLVDASDDTEMTSKEEPSSAERRTTRSSMVAAPKPVNVEDIVKSVKAAPPRKYHRIFRSRNKGYMEPQEEVSEPSPPASQETSQDTPPSSQPDTEATPDTQATPEVVIEDITEATPDGEEGGTMKLPLLINVNADSADTDIELSQQSTASDATTDLDASQQSVASDGNTADGENSSQEVTTEPPLKKVKTLKTPPAERKIFRARSAQTSVAKKIFSSPKKAAAVYNVRSWQDEEDQPPGLVRNGANSAKEPSPVSEPPKLKPVLKKRGPTIPGQTPAQMPRLTRAVHWQGQQGEDAYTSVHVTKEHKELYTVVKNVKEAHECQEFGETQEFDDDIEYLLAGIENIEPMTTRCLSCVGLAQKCTIPAFRMHIRAHGTVAKIFGCLSDAASDPSLALCTSSLMFMLSRDRLNMDLDQDSLNLMLRLLGVDQQEDLGVSLTATAARALKRNKDRVHEVYLEFLKQSGTKQDNIDVDCLSTGNLAMESLLSLTSRRAGEWFKEELRSLGALDHIVDTVCSCIVAVGDETRCLTNSNIENLKKTDRCLRVLENVTYLNADNQMYLITYKDSCLVPSLNRGLKLCRSCLAVYPLTESPATGKVDKESYGWVVYSCILAILRVLLNLTHDNDTGCCKIGEQSYLIETVLLCIFQSPQYVPIDLRFDLYVLSLGLLINLIEHSELNCQQLITMQTVPMYENPVQNREKLAYLSLVEVFNHRELSARQLEEADEPKTPEASPNKSGEWRESDSGMEWVIDSAKKDRSASKPGPNKPTEDNGKDLDDEETFTKALHKAGKHMENSIVAAYVALLVGCLIQGNKEMVEEVRSQLPDNSFDSMIYMLKKFLGFMNLTSGSGSAGGKSIERVISVLEKC